MRSLDAWYRIALLVAVSVAAVACSSPAGGGASSPDASAVPASAEPVPESAAPASASPSPIASGNSGGGRGDYDYDYDYGTGASPAAPAAASVLIETASGDVGVYLTDADGMTLYTFKPDEELVSTCEAACADAWPPLIVEDGASVEGGDGVTGSLETFERPDGSTQVAYDGAPLYYFARDTAPGEVNGHGAGDAWFVAVP